MLNREMLQENQPWDDQERLRLGLQTISEETYPFEYIWAESEARKERLGLWKQRGKIVHYGI